MPAFDSSVAAANGPKDWFSALPKYFDTGFVGTDKTKNKTPIYMCPTSRPEWEGQTYWWDNRPVSYAISLYSSAAVSTDHFGFYTYTRGDYWQADTFILFADCNPNGAALPSGLTAWSYSLLRGNSFNSIYKCLSLRHGEAPSIYVEKGSNGRSNCVYLDGHAKATTAEDFVYNDLSPLNGRLCPISNSTGKVSTVFP